MDDIGVRELKTHASEIVRNVKEHGKRYMVTHRGRPAALIVPVEESAPTVASAETASDAWEELIRLGDEIGRGWQASQSSVELLSEMRR